MSDILQEMVCFELESATEPKMVVVGLTQAGFDMLKDETFVIPHLFSTNDAKASFRLALFTAETKAELLGKVKAVTGMIRDSKEAETRLAN